MAHPTVLVVDDDVAIRDALRDVLGPEGFDVSVAQNGAVGLTAMRSSCPDIVVLDLMMPVLSGWEVLEVTDADADLRDIPIIVLSAMCAPLASAERRGGVRHSFCKPVDLDALVGALQSLTSDASVRAADAKEDVRG
jgi:CheY-like chemotaxis protein